MSSLHEIRDGEVQCLVTGLFVWACTCGACAAAGSVSEQEARWAHWVHRVHADVVEAGAAS